ncbi:MAG: hypothetical protein K0R82_532 [Flavipsychrobacter sp.]|jgi:hypothetical protein|nr:hypothetical protein [Flavipsychrobacter sp.]
MILNRKDLNGFLFALFYGLGFHLFQFFLAQRGMVSKFPTGDQLVKWDAIWYHSLAEKGYEWFDNSGCNAAFYPLFSFIWHLTGAGGWGISVINIFLLAAGFAAFCSIYKLTSMQKFVWLSIPSMYFCFIPYSEAAFILAVSISFLGIVKNNRWLIWTGLFLMSLSRSVSLIMIPAFITAELVTNDRSNWLAALRHSLVRYVFPLMLGTALFVWYQFYKTGVWFAYFIQQAKYWGHEFSWPALPFNSMFGPGLLWLNGLAIFLCTGAIVVLLIKGFRWLVKNEMAGDRLMIISYGYMAGLLLVTIFFNPKWGTETTNVYDIHRYLFATPFFWVFLHHYTVNASYKAADFLWVFLAANACWLLFASYNHIQSFIYFNFGTLLLLVYMLWASKQMSWLALAIVAINVFLQVQMFQHFINDIYPG